MSIELKKFDTRMQAGEAPEVRHLNPAAAPFYLPIGDEEVDVAMLSQALHHAVQPARAVAEAARITAPGGRVLVLDVRTGLGKVEVQRG